MRRHSPVSGAFGTSVLRIGGFVAGLAAVVIASGCGGEDSIAAAEVLPAIEQACQNADARLLELVGESPTEQTVSDAAASVRSLWGDIPDVETDVGNPDRLIGDSARIVGRRLGDISYSFERGSEFGDTDAAAMQLQELLDEVQEESKTFGLDRCLSEEAGRVVVAQVDSVELFAASIEPTGDYEIDIAAVCGRLRDDVAVIFADSLGDPNSRLLVLTRVSRIAERFGADLDRIDPPTDRAQRHGQLRAVVRNYVGAIEQVESAQLVSEAALDEALATFEAIEIELDDLLVESFPEC